MIAAERLMSKALPTPAEFRRWSGLLAGALAQVRSAFADDLDQYLLYMIFVEAELERLSAARGARRYPCGDCAPRGLNALWVARATQLPRETVRRKLRALREAGFLRLGPDGLHYLSGRHGLDAFIGHLQPLAAPVSGHV